MSEPATVATSGAVELLQKFRSEAGFETWDGLVLELFQWAIFGINNSKKTIPTFNWMISHQWYLSTNLFQINSLQFKEKNNLFSTLSNSQPFRFDFLLVLSWRRLNVQTAARNMTFVVA